MYVRTLQRFKRSVPENSNMRNVLISVSVRAFFVFVVIAMLPAAARPQGSEPLAPQALMAMCRPVHWRASGRRDRRPRKQESLLRRYRGWRRLEKLGWFGMGKHF